MTGRWIKEDQEYWNKPENRLLFEVNCLFTSKDLFERNPETAKLRDEELRRLFKSFFEKEGCRISIGQDFKKKLALSFPLSKKQIDILYNWILENCILKTDTTSNNWLNDKCINNACWFYCNTSKNNCANKKINEDITSCSPRLEHKQLLNQIIGKEKK